MKLNPLLFILLAVLLGCLLSAAGCGDDDDDDDESDDDVADDDVVDDDQADDDIADDDITDDDLVDDDQADDDTIDDDTADDDTADDDTADDDTYDIYVAPWPQSNIEIQDYNETPDAGPMRLKAEEYDLWHEANHQPFFGSNVGTVFTDPSRTTVQYYFDYGDSCIWTGTYLTGQAFRYYITGDEQAKENVIKVAQALDGHLHVTGRTGFIARYRAPQDPLVYPGDANCDLDDSCHHIEDGPYADQFWIGNTSRDQYTGWFMGMCLAYDLVDDEDTREMIADDVAEVLDELIGNSWFIIDVDGLPTSAAPNVLPIMRLSWALIGYHVTGEVQFKEQVQKLIKDSARTMLRLSNVTFMNKYSQYYGNNLGHENFYNMLRLAEVYLNEEDYAYLKNMFNKSTHRYVRLSHNAWFNGIHMSQGVYSPELDDDPYQQQLEQDLSEFRPAPNYRYYVDPQTTNLDPLSVFLDNLMEEWPWLAELLGNVDPQAMEAFPVLEQCTTDFLWQRNPFHVGPCGSDSPQVVNPGVDYLAAYWLASYHKFIAKEN